MIKWKHWVARANTPYEPFKDFTSAQFSWRLLHLLFPDLLAAVLMPNHLHLVLPAKDLETDLKHRNQLDGFLGGVSQYLHKTNLWQQRPEPTAIPDQIHLKRVIRYIALNPCRKNLCQDPLEWYWSTYRELMGATPEHTAMYTRVAGSLSESPPPLQSPIPRLYVQR